MHRLKDIARRMDDCHERTAKRWWKKLGVPPDVRGHGPHRWEDATADKLIKLWKTHYTTRGTTPQIEKAKFAGHLTDEKQFEQAMRSLDRDAEGKKSGMMDRMFYNGQRAGAMLTELAEQTRRVLKTNRGNTSHCRIFRTEQQ